MKKCFFALVLPLALLLTACGRESRPAALLLGQAADLDESETLLVIDGQSIPAWEYLYWLALDCRQMEERCEAAGESVDWTAPLSDGGTLEDLVKADALADTALYAAVGTWAAVCGCGGLLDGALRGGSRLSGHRRLSRSWSQCGRQRDQ